MKEGRRKLVTAPEADTKGVACSFDDQLLRWKQFYAEYLDDPTADNVEDGTLATGNEHNLRRIPWNFWNSLCGRLNVVKRLEQVELIWNTANIFKCARPPIRWVKRLFDSIFKFRRIPREWRGGVILLIYKKGVVTNCNVYCSVTLLDSTRK